jgi:hypothetical protein
MMAVLDEFYKEEIALNIVNWEYDDDQRNTKKELDAIKSWWDNYPNRLAEINSKLMAWSSYVNTRYNVFLKDEDGQEKILFAQITEAEDKLDNEEQEMLHRLINVRKGMWT